MNSIADSGALYDRLIVERARTPQYAGRLEQADAQGEGKNPLCGDKTRVDIVMADTHIRDIRHHTRGCAICLAAADLMAERVTGRTVAQAQELSQKFSAMLVGEPASTPETTTDTTALGPLEAFAPLRAHRARIRCAELPWVALKEALSHVAV
ncbi:Fe-S cluster assembly sulfur transfer protein SufU [Acetobacter orleanensis]|uniref:Iron-sulfur cluster assembly scaffold protein n=1 Tax=Acetobacter orleanensis TaxID=104099 RepID=A0A4Y3TMS1_9PROT|nr:SUF system NifU family Fe-S cluster assembly protein [Acetobacter orleanensis]KXV65562.1 nitrogen fixation protein NifU [Acetobacter orleanensis]PCD79102.1 SUF system NifU family Fe-S cluster assembly protein [Acetobacter orleanensis]GAN67695.1 Fe-S cluster assembling protein of nitrogenase NifU-SUF [Acetobacter orleanensis JCM 7639]GBR22264.1 NifU family SUF system FeS assembly protein [Acetobacter orleanensis NRIC 0473]GEB83033.1 iron-sulfur cluster assembly scaffold protein [Acetobacter 